MERRQHTSEPDMTETQSDKKEGNEKDRQIKELGRLLKLSEQGKAKIELMYRGCEEQVKILQEEKDRLKVDVIDLREYITKNENKKSMNIEENSYKKKVCKFLWKEKRETYANKVKNSSKNQNEIMHNCH